jgi:hypothetical protein
MFKGAEIKAEPGYLRERWHGESWFTVNHAGSLSA